MSLEYLLVVYKQDRDVLADGDRVGVTNHTILLAPDEYNHHAQRGRLRAAKRGRGACRHINHASESCRLYLSSDRPCGP
jgi:hypothetical protein